ncbi:MAG: 4'-phosphopantetheinyl transferase superfamily protein [Desulfovibrionales bacterium]|nr:4'-phosphopantetheinyl transferase superfamily protein [Desulfovibrionales bacterium]
MDIEIFCIACADVEAMHDKAVTLVTPARRAQMERLQLPGDQLRCLGAGLLLRHVLGVQKDSQLSYGEYGKPYLSCQGAPGFSLAHAGDFALLAVGPPVLGADIEPWSAAQWGHTSQAGPTARDTCMVHTWMTECEQEVWLGASEPEEFFLRAWTGKESLLKATGQGFHLDPASFSVLPLTDGPRLFQGCEWTVMWRSVQKHQLAVATQAPVAGLNLIMLSACDLVPSIVAR